MAVALAATRPCPSASNLSTAAHDSDGLDCYEEAAVWFCPLH